MEPAEDQITLGYLPTGTRLIVRSRANWRFAAVSKRVDGRVVLTVCSPNGRTYRLRREIDAAIVYEGMIPILPFDNDENWRDNFGVYDTRW